VSADTIAATLAGLQEKLHRALLAGKPTAGIHAEIAAVHERQEQAAGAAQDAAARAATAEAQAREMRVGTLAARISAEAGERLRAMLARLAPSTDIIPVKGHTP
jgi:hypothetical protein